MSAYGRLWEQARNVRERIQAIAPHLDLDASIQERIDAVSKHADDEIALLNKTKGEQIYYFQTLGEELKAIEAQMAATEDR